MVRAAVEIVPLALNVISQREITFYFTVFRKAAKKNR